MWSPVHAFFVAACWLPGLNTSTTYYYRVGGSSMGTFVWSSEFSFKSAPQPGPNQPVKMAAYGDMGTVMPLVRPACARQRRCRGHDGRGCRVHHPHVLSRGQGVGHRRGAPLGP